MARPTPELAAHLPLLQLQELRKAIGSSLLDVERRIWGSAERFVQNSREPLHDYFSLSVGATTFRFSGSVGHVLTVWEPQFSVLVGETLPELPPEAMLSRLSYETNTTDDLRSFLGRECTDVRVWTFDDGCDGTEAKQCAVSYKFKDRELFYCIYLHGRDDDDCVVERHLVDLSEVRECYSIVEMARIEP